MSNDETTIEEALDLEAERDALQDEKRHMLAAFAETQRVVYAVIRGKATTEEAEEVLDSLVERVLHKQTIHDWLGDLHMDLTEADIALRKNDEGAAVEALWDLKERAYALLCAYTQGNIADRIPGETGDRDDEPSPAPPPG